MTIGNKSIYGRGLIPFLLRSFVWNCLASPVTKNHGRIFLGVGYIACRLNDIARFKSATEIVVLCKVDDISFLLNFILTKVSACTQDSA